MARPRTIKRTVTLHPAQAAFRNGTACYRGFVGGVGSGKSFAGCYDLLRRAAPGRLYMAVAPTYPMLRDATLRTFLALSRQLCFLRDLSKTDLVATLGNGAEVLFRSADDPDRLRGPNLSGAFIDEASLCDREAYNVLIGRLREGSRQGWLSACFTPRGRSHWTFDLFGRGAPDTALYHTRTADNPFLPAGFADTLARQYGGAESLLARQELSGEFLDLEGCEWPASYFSGADLWFTDWPEGLVSRTLALDPSKGKDARKGDYAALVELACDRQGLLWCEADLVRGRSAEWVADWTVDRAARFRPDLAGVESNQFLQLFAVLIAQSASRRGRTLPLVEIHNHAPKLVRIRRLGPYLCQRRMRFRDTPGTRLLVEQLREFPEGEHDDGCFAAGTLISTPGGERPIEAIRAGDLVLTRHGYRRVLLAGCTGIRPTMTVETSDGKGLTGTPSHPVFSGMAVVPIRCVDTMWSCQANTGRFTAFSGPKESSSTASCSAATRARNSGRTGCTTALTRGTGATASAACIRRCGRPPTAPFLRECTSTTRTTTRSTTCSKIWSASRRRSTPADTARTQAVALASRRTLPCWMPFARLPGSGTVPTPGVSGTVRTASEPGKDGSPFPCPVLTAASPTKRSARLTASSAPPDAGSEPTRPTVVMQAVSVLARREAARQPVYNLTVEGGEYVANGLLVHNCDAAEMALRLMEGLWVGAHEDTEDETVYRA